MLGISRHSFWRIDWILVGLAAALLTFGMLNLYSATHIRSGEVVGPEFQRQLVSLVMGSIGLIVATLVDYRRLERFAIPLFFVCILFLAATLLFAPLTRGNRSWLIYGPLSLQPAELAKLGMVLVLARHFHHRSSNELSHIRGLLIPGCIVAIPVGLIILQQDLGVAVLTALIASTYLPFFRIPLREWFILGTGGLVILVGVWRLALKDYQRERVLDFLDPARDPLASGYQAIQSKIAVGSGSFFGRGYLEGTQTQLQFLPTQHSDFVFSVLAEEWGFVGSILVLGLYLGLLLWGLLIASNAKETFGAMLAVGIVGILFWPAAVNIAMVLGLAPVVGVPLPFFSYGGSALLASMIGLGLLLNISMRRYVFSEAL